jgi:hypothetical protein
MQLNKAEQFLSLDRYQLNKVVSQCGWIVRKPVFATNPLTDISLCTPEELADFLINDAIPNGYQIVNKDGKVAVEKHEVNPDVPVEEHEDTKVTEDDEDVTPPAFPKVAILPKATVPQTNTNFEFVPVVEELRNEVADLRMRVVTMTMRLSQLLDMQVWQTKHIERLMNASLMANSVVLGPQPREYYDTAFEVLALGKDPKDYAIPQDTPTELVVPKKEVSEEEVPVRKKPGRPKKQVEEDNDDVPLPPQRMRS